jgi:hypothetical protein
VRCDELLPQAVAFHQGRAFYAGED